MFFIYIFNILNFLLVCAKLEDKIVEDKIPRHDTNS